MKAIWVDQPGAPLQIRKTKDPAPQAGELLVRVKATALNRADLLQKQGHYAPPPGSTSILGLEMAGVVEQVGAEVSHWKPGDSVMALLPGGGYAEKVTIPADMAITVPHSFTWNQAAAIPEAYLTAYLNLLVLGRFQENQDLLLHAGASGVGTAVIQLASEMKGRTLVTAGSKEKLELCRQLGAEVIINYRKESFADVVQKTTNGRGVDLIFDPIGASYWEANLQSLRTDGRMVLIGTMGGSRLKNASLLPLLTRRLTLIGSTLRSLPPERKKNLTWQFASFALPRWSKGRLTPVIDSVWNWDQVNEAHSHMENNRNLGKIILQIS